MIELMAGYTNYLGYNIYTPSYSILYDPYKPTIHNINPLDETTNKPETNITFIIIDEALNISSVQPIIMLNSEEEQQGTIGYTKTYTIRDYNAKEKAYDFTINPYGISSTDLADGEYNVTLNVKDYAGNTLNTSWSFEVNENALSSPDFRWRHGFIQPSPLGIYYINNVLPKFVLVYPLSDVLMPNITLDQHQDWTECDFIDFEELDDDIKEQLDEPSNSTVVNCSFNSTITEGAHNLKAKAKTEESDSGYKIFHVNIDTDIPSYSLTMPTVTRSNVTVPININVSNEDEVMVIVNVSGVAEELETIGQDRHFHFEIPADFDWGVPLNSEQNKNVVLTVSDYAGNHVTETRVIKIDNIAPQFEITGIYPQCIELNVPTGDCATNAINLRIEGNLTYTDTVFMMAYEGDVYSPETRRGEISSCQGGQVVNCIGANRRFSMNITLGSQTGEEVMNTLNLIAVDAAGNEFGAVLRILHDSLPPAQPHITIT